MSSNDAIMIRKVNENTYEVRRIGCVDLLGEIDENTKEEYIGGLESTHKTQLEAHKHAFEIDDTEYGISFQDDSKKETERELLQKTISDFNNHDELDNIKCPHCGSSYLTERAGLTYHDHPPLNQCVEEILECECGQYCQVIWKLDSVHKLGRLVV